MPEEEIECPVDGCDYEGSKTQLSSHANAKTDHPNWAEIKDRVKETGESTPSKGAEGAPEGGDSDPSDEETGETTGKAQDGESPNEPSKAVEKGPEEGAEGGESNPSDEETGKSKDGVNESGGEKGPEGGALETQESDTDMETDENQWSKAVVESQESNSKGAVDGAGDEESGDTSGDEGGGIPIPVSSTTLFIGVGLVVMGVLLYKWANMGDESTASGETEIESAQKSDEEAPSEGGLMTG